MRRLSNYFIILCFYLLFLTQEVFSQPSFCASENEETEDSLLIHFKERFNEEMKTHYDSLSISESEKRSYLKQYENPKIIVCSNSDNVSQKIVYIEYEKNWWGSLYFTVVKKRKILKWIKIETYGAITKSVRWGNTQKFFYEDSTHMGTKTQNTCLIQESSVKCKKANLATSKSQQDKNRNKNSK